MRATEILTNDHRMAEQLMTQLQEADGEDSGASYRPIFAELDQALSLHMEAEEKIFYPAAGKFEDLKDLVVEAYDEHALVKSQLAQMRELEPNTDEFQEVLTQMMAGIEHHVSEEEGEMFPKIEEAMGDAHLQEIGSQIEQLRAQAGSSRTARM